VAIYLIELADISGIDLAKAIEAKLEKNARKYPVYKARGRSTKYAGQPAVRAASQGRGRRHHRDAPGPGRREGRHGAHLEEARGELGRMQDGVRAVVGDLQGLSEVRAPRARRCGRSSGNQGS
jgi:hypothetical protein